MVTKVWKLENKITIFGLHMTKTANANNQKVKA